MRPLYLLVLVAALTIESCRHPNVAVPSAPRLITSTAGANEHEVVLGDGSRHLVRFVPGEDKEAGEREGPNGLLGNVNDPFTGTCRAAAKISMASAAGTTYTDLYNFLIILPQDAAMRALHISNKATSGRVSQENYNAKFPAYLYAVAYENDGDYHLIVGQPINSSSAYLLNIEISGLPASSNPSYATLAAVRTTFYNYMAHQLPTRGYEVFVTGIPMTFGGSWYYDVCHGVGKVGPKGYKPSTAWEIHPVTYLTIP